MLYAKQPENSLAVIRDDPLLPRPQLRQSRRYSQPNPPPMFRAGRSRSPCWPRRCGVGARFQQGCHGPRSLTLTGNSKSQLAIELAYRIAEEAADTWVFWAHAGARGRRAQNGRRRRQAARPEAAQDEHTTTRIQLAVWFIVVGSADDSDVFHGASGRTADNDESDKVAVANFLRQPTSSLTVPAANLERSVRSRTPLVAPSLQSRSAGEHHMGSTMHVGSPRGTGQQDARALVHYAYTCILAI